MLSDAEWLFVLEVFDIDVVEQKRAELLPVKVAVKV